MVGMGLPNDVTSKCGGYGGDDNFANDCLSGGEGRRIYDNIRKSIQSLPHIQLLRKVYLFATLRLLVILEAGPPPLINLITDQPSPALALGMEEPEKGRYEPPPQKLLEGRIFRRGRTECGGSGIVALQSPGFVSDRAII